MATSERGGVSFELIKLQRLAHAFEQVGTGTASDAPLRETLVLVDELGKIAIRLCLRELASPHDQRASLALTLLLHLGNSPEKHSHVLDTVRQDQSLSHGSPRLKRRISSLIAALGPAQPQAVLEHGIALLDEGDPAQARPVLERYLTSTPTCGPGLAALARCLAALDAFDEARKLLLRACQIDPEEAGHFWQLAVVAHAQTRTGSDYMALCNYLDLLDDGAIDGSVSVQTELDRRIDTAEKRIAAYEHAVQRDFPNSDPTVVAHVDDLLYRARAIAIAGSAGDAIAVLEQAVSAVPGHYEAWTRLGIAHLAEGYADEAHACIQRALDLHPDYELAIRALRTLPHVEGTPEDAHACDSTTDTAS